MFWLGKQKKRVVGLALIVIYIFRCPFKEMVDQGLGGVGRYLNRLLIDEKIWRKTQEKEKPLQCLLLGLRCILSKLMLLSNFKNVIKTEETIKTLGKNKKTEKKEKKEEKPKENSDVQGCALKEKEQGKRKLKRFATFNISEPGN